MKTKTTVADVYKFAHSADCPIVLCEAVISAIQKVFYSLDTEIKHEIIEAQNEFMKLSKKKLKKVFISQPMRGKTDEEILEERRRLKELLIQNFGDTPIEVLDTFFPNLEIPDDVKHPKIYYLSKSIEMLSKADILLMADDWERYHGCIFERDIFRTYNFMGGLYDEAELRERGNKEELNND